MAEKIEYALVMYTQPSTIVYDIPRGTTLPYYTVDPTEKYIKSSNQYTVRSNILVPPRGVVSNVSDASDNYLLLSFTTGENLLLPVNYISRKIVKEVRSSLSANDGDTKYVISADLNKSLGENLFVESTIQELTGQTKSIAKTYKNGEMYSLDYEFARSYGHVILDKEKNDSFFMAAPITNLSPKFNNAKVYNRSSRKIMYVNGPTSMITCPYNLLNTDETKTIDDISGFLSNEVATSLNAKKNLPVSTGKYFIVNKIKNDRSLFPEYGGYNWGLAFSPEQMGWRLILLNENVSEYNQRIAATNTSPIETPKSSVKEFNVDIDGNHIKELEVNVTPDEDIFEYPKVDALYNLDLGNDIDPNSTSQYQHNYTAETGENLYDILSRESEYRLISEDPASGADLRNSYLINRFRLTTNEDAVSKRRSFIFFTRPDLNLFQKGEPDSTNDDNTSGLNETIQSNEITEELSYIPIFNYLNGISKNQTSTSNILKSLEYYDWPNNTISTPWLSILSNQGSGYSISDRRISTSDSTESIHGHSVSYGITNFDHEKAGTVDINFRERKDFSVYYTLKAWTEYIHNVSYGRISPKFSHKINGELDYAVSLYYIATDITMENIVYWEKLTGVFPLSAPDGQFSWDSAENNYDVQFVYSFRSILDEYDLYELNWLYDTTKLTSNNKTEMAFSAYNGPQFNKNESFSKHLIDIASLYGMTNLKTAWSKLGDDSFIKKLYCANEVIPTEDMSSFLYNTSENHMGYNDILLCPNESPKKHIFLPNYIPTLHTYGIPYVKGPYITKMLKPVGENKYDGLYKLRWI